MQFWFNICCKSRFSYKAPTVINIKKIGLLPEQHGDEKLYLQALCLFRKHWMLFSPDNTLEEQLRENKPFGLYFTFFPPRRWPVIFPKWQKLHKFLHLPTTCLGRIFERLNSRILNHNIRIIKNDLEGFLPQQACPEVLKISHHYYTKR